MATDKYFNISGERVQGNILENYGTVNQSFIYQVSELIGGQASGTQQPLTQIEYRQRTVLLSKVKKYWIEGVLEKSLHTQATIELGLEKRADAIEPPFKGFEELPEESRQTLPTGTSATEFFNQIGEGRTLLILGEPGAGKTTILLQLAQNLIARAEKDLSRLIPVVFNLSSWGSKPQRIDNWLVEELWSKYQVSKEVGNNWVKNQQLLLLLDGLDEVKADLREACVEAINEFTQKNGQTEMVVCSRIADYQILSHRLQLRGAIYIRSLTSNQVNQYLNAAGKQLQAVKTLLQEDTALQELATSPLTLSIMTLAYQGKKVKEILQTGSVQERREHLFDTYIKRMFSQELIGKPEEYKSQYQNQQTKRWLTWLAQRMSQASETVFFIERIQPTWLSNSGQKIFYRWGTLLIGLLMGLLIGSLVGRPIQGLIIGLSIVLPLAWWKMNEWKLALRMDEIKPVETLKLPWQYGNLKWSWQEAMKFALKGLLSGLPLGMIVGISIKSEKTLSLMIAYGLISGIILSLLGGLIGPDIEEKTYPNQGIWNSAKNAIILGIIGALFGLMIGSIMDSDWWNLGLIFGLIFGLVFGGGKACLQHFILRFILWNWNKGFIPWNYARFLNYATERIFLQKVGGGYIFVHRMLLEHFAKMG
jgi:energy-coupling factor transporter ATP-binding protein EcfA2